MPTEIKIQCECSKFISKSNISTHKATPLHFKLMKAIGKVEPQEFENTIICHEVKPLEEKVVKKTSQKKATEKKTVEKKTTSKKRVKKVKVSKRFLTAITKVINMKIINITHINLEVAKPIVNSDKLNELKSVIDNCLNIISELQEENKVLKLEVETTQLSDNLFDDQEIDQVYRYTVWINKQYFTNRVIEEIKRMRHPIFKGIDEEEEIKIDNAVVDVIEEVKLVDKKEMKRKADYAKTKQRKKELEIQNSIAVLFDEEFDTSKPYLCDIEYAGYKELKNYKTRISNALKWIDESLEDCFHIDYTYSIIYNIKNKDIYLHMTDIETGKLFVRLCKTKIYYDANTLYNKPNPDNANFTMKKIDKKPLVILFEKLQQEIINILPT